MFSAHLHLVINLPRRLSSLYRLFHNTWQPLQATQKQWTKFISQIRVLSDPASNLWPLLCFDNAQLLSSRKMLQTTIHDLRADIYQTSVVSKNFAILQKFHCTWNDVLVISNTFNEDKLSDYCNAKVSVTLKQRQTRHIFVRTFFIFSFLCPLLTPDIVGPTCYETACISLFQMFSSTLIHQTGGKKFIEK